MVRVPHAIPVHLRNPRSLYFYKRGDSPLLERSIARMCCCFGNGWFRRKLPSENTPSPKERKRNISSRDLHKLFAKMIRPSCRRYLFKHTITRRDQLIRERKKRQAEKRRILSPYVGTPRVPVYVMLPLGAINMKCQLVGFRKIYSRLKELDSINVDGVTVVAWWGIVEADNPRQYNWLAYEVLLKMLEDRNLKLQVVMAFHEYGGNDVYIPLPKWIKEIGEENPDICFTDRDGRRNPETLTWGIDEERVLGGRTALEVYFEFMRSFRVKFDEFFKNGTITKIEIGLGACGELRYPSYPAKRGWEYPGVGEFQCYDKYLRKCLEEAAEASGNSSWGSPPNNAGSYNSQPQDTGFFCDGGDYRTAYGRFFLNWYSQCLIDHADRVLVMAKMAFSEDTPIGIKLPSIHWWYKSESHAAELTAGFYNAADRNGYAPIASMLKKKQVALNFTCAEPRTLEGFPEAMADLRGLASQVLNAAWDADIPGTSENAVPCYDRQGYNKILEHAKPRNDPDGRHLSAFTYRWLDDDLFEKDNFREFKLFVKRMHGVKRRKKNQIRI